LLVLHVAAQLFKINALSRNEFFFLNDNDCRLDPLVNITLSERGRQDHHTGVAFFGEAIYAVVVSLVVHPKFKLIQKSLVFPKALVDWHEVHFNWRVVEDHVQFQFHNCAQESQKVSGLYIVNEHFNLVRVHVCLLLQCLYTLGLEAVADELLQLVF